MKPSFHLYNKSGTAQQAVAVLDIDGERYIAFQGPSITQLRARIGEYKRQHGLIGTSEIPHVEESLTQSELDEMDGYAGAQAVAAANEEHLPIDLRFDYMKVCIDTILAGDVPAGIVTGQGGLGKSYTVVEHLTARGYKSFAPETSSDEEDSDGPQGEIEYEIDDGQTPYLHARGALSPTELFKLLCDNKHMLIVFDDCDSVWLDEIRQNILKAVLDTTGDRTVSWHSPFLAKQGYPSSFTFEGRIIFISNRTMDKIPDPIRSRAYCIDLAFTLSEVIERMHSVAPAMVGHLLPADQIKEVIDHLDTIKHLSKNFNLRKLLQAAAIRKQGRADWRAIVKFLMK